MNEVLVLAIAFFGAALLYSSLKDRAAAGVVSDETGRKTPGHPEGLSP